MMDLTIPYYEDNSRISNSSIGIFLNKGAKYFRDYTDGKTPKLEGAFLDKGTMIHMWLLEPDEFWKEYIVLDFKTPSSKYHTAFAEAYANSTELLPNMKLYNAYKDAGYVLKGKSEDKILEHAREIKEQLSDYIEYLQTTKTTNKKIISWSDVNMLKEIKKNVENHKFANSLMFNLPDTCEAYNEFHINWDFPKEYHNVTLKCKSLIDRVLIDHTKKHITLIDLKTTVDVLNFRESIQKYDYIRQLSYYWMAIHWYFKNELNIDISEYTYSTYIIAVQSKDGYPVKVFEFNPSDLEDKLDTISNAISEICWHTQNNEWDYDYGYYTGSGVEVY